MKAEEDWDNGDRIICPGTDSIQSRIWKRSLDTNDEWIYKRTGIRERRIAAPDVNASDLAKEASLRAIEMAGLSAKDLDLIIMTTMTPDTCLSCRRQLAGGEIGGGASRLF